MNYHLFDIIHEPSGNIQVKRDDRMYDITSLGRVGRQIDASIQAKKNKTKQKQTNKQNKANKKNQDDALLDNLLCVI